MFCDETKIKNQDNPECVPSLHAQVDVKNVTAEKAAARCVRSCTFMTKVHYRMVLTRSRLENVEPLQVSAVGGPSIG